MSQLNIRDKFNDVALPVVGHRGGASPSILILRCIECRALVEMPHAKVHYEWHQSLGNRERK